MKFFSAGRGSRLHTDPDCRRLNCYQRKTPVREVDPAKESYLRFCKDCCPSELSDRPTTVHRQCSTCGWTRPFPCPHNGGVPVVRVIPESPGMLRRVRIYYRWPENLAGAVLAADALALLATQE